MTLNRLCKDDIGIFLGDMNIHLMNFDNEQVETIYLLVS